MERVAIIPAYISKPNHVEMLRCQTLLTKMLDIKVLVVFDYIKEEYRAAIDSLDFEWSIKLQGEANGVRCPTEHGIREIRNVVGDCYVLRNIQDVFITDPVKLKEQMREAVNHSGQWLAGDLGYYYGYLKHMEDVGVYLENKNRYERIQGAFMFAPLSAWERYYLRMPSNVIHFADEDTMSQWLMHEGGSLLHWEKTWEHHHDASIAELQSVYRRGQQIIHGNY